MSKRKKEDRGQRLRRADHPDAQGALLWVHRFKNVEELRLALLDWADRYNRSWLIERHGFLTPQQAREQFVDMKIAA